MIDLSLEIEKIRHQIIPAMYQFIHFRIPEFVNPPRIIVEPGLS